MTRTRRAAVASMLALIVSSPITGTGTAVAQPAPRPAEGVRLELPRPTGAHPVGRATVHLVDRARRDPWVPEAGARELMVAVYYPARHGGGRPAPYLSTEEARPLLASRGLDGLVPAEVVSGTRTHARAGAHPARGRFPLVVLSPGFTLPRATLTVLAEDLASRGYVVATVDHAFESVGTAFPGGRMLTCVACLHTGEVGMAAVAEGRAKDLSFVLDRLTGPRPAWRHARMIDPGRIGMAGHSVGGNSAAQTMAGDRRVRAGVNLDGTFYAPVPTRGLGGRAFMLLGTESGHRPGGIDTTWDRDWARLDGWKRWLTVAGSGHFTFTDIPVLGAQLGITDPRAPLSGQRSGEITRDYVGAFFELHLRAIPQPLLHGPSPAHPEVEFWRPGARR